MKKFSWFFLSKYMYAYWDHDRHIMRFFVFDTRWSCRWLCIEFDGVDDISDARHHIRLAKNKTVKDWREYEYTLLPWRVNIV